MKTFVINLEKDSDRKSHMINLLKKYNLDFELITAIEGKKLKDIDKYINLNKLKCIENINRELTPGEIGCILSHQKIYRKIINEKIETSLILEDDIFFNSSLMELLNNIKSLKINYDVILLGYHETSSRDKFEVGNKTIHHFANDCSIKKTSQLACGTYGYIISLNGSKKILTQSKKFDLPIDHYTGNFYINDIFHIYPPVIHIFDNLSNENDLEKERFSTEAFYKNHINKYYEILITKIKKENFDNLAIFGFNELGEKIYNTHEKYIKYIFDNKKHDSIFKNQKISLFDPNFDFKNTLLVITAINENAINEIKNQINSKREEDMQIISL